MLEYGLRFLAGGIAVSAFAALGDALRPKSFAGLFGAAPSIALATLLITLSHKGAPPHGGECARSPGHRRVAAAAVAEHQGEHAAKVLRILRCRGLNFLDVATPFGVRRRRLGSVLRDMGDSTSYALAGERK